MNVLNVSPRIVKFTRSVNENVLPRLMFSLRMKGERYFGLLRVALPKVLASAATLGNALMSSQRSVAGSNSEPEMFVRQLV